MSAESSIFVGSVESVVIEMGFVIPELPGVPRVPEVSAGSCCLPEVPAAGEFLS